MYVVSLIVFVLGVLSPLVVGDSGGIFIATCGPLTVQRADPIVNPGVAGTHTHTVVGGNAFSRSMNDKNAAVIATGTTCNKALDHSNYWVPSLYHMRDDKMWELIPHQYSKIYYLKRACDFDPANPTKRSCDDAFKAGALPLAFPDGFRMVAGDPARRTQNSTDFAQKAVSMVCLDGTVPEGPGFPKSFCSALRAQVFFPSCWNGKDLDTPNHRDHVAYPAYGDYNGGVCPKSHPVGLMSLFFEFFFPIKGIKDTNRFAWSCGDPTGYGYHGDFIMGWTNRTALQHGWEGCINQDNCPNLGNQGTEKQALIHPAIYEEEVGLNGPIAKLPGNNPVVFPN
jgi:hypothetical protein